MAHLKFLGTENTPYGIAHFFKIEGEFEGFHFTGLSWGITENDDVIAAENNTLLDADAPLAIRIKKIVTMERKELFKAPRKAIIKDCVNEDYWYSDKLGLEVLVREPYEGSWGFELVEGYAPERGSSIYRHDLEFITE